MQALLVGVSCRQSPDVDGFLLRLQNCSPAGFWRASTFALLRINEQVLYYNSVRFGEKPKFFGGAYVQVAVPYIVHRTWYT